MKACRECGEQKPIEEFYRHVGMADGHLNKCKPCVRSRVVRHREANLERVRAHDRKRGNRQTLEHLREYRASNPEKWAAHIAVNNAVRSGKLVKPSSCSACDRETVIHGHHDDYSKPLDVYWLCAACHKQRHKELGWGYAANAIQG